MREGIILTVALALSGCAISSGVIETSPGVYSVSESVGVIRGGVAGARKLAFEKARLHCASQGMAVETVQQSSSFQPVSGLETAEVTFRCVKAQ